MEALLHERGLAQPAIQPARQPYPPLPSLGVTCLWTQKVKSTHTVSRPLPPFLQLISLACRAMAQLHPSQLSPSLPGKQLRLDAFTWHNAQNAHRPYACADLVALRATGRAAIYGRNPRQP